MSFLVLHQAWDTTYHYITRNEKGLPATVIRTFPLSADGVGKAMSSAYKGVETKLIAFKDAEIPKDPEALMSMCAMKISLKEYQGVIT